MERWRQRLELWSPGMPRNDKVASSCQELGERHSADSFSEPLDRTHPADHLISDSRAGRESIFLGETSLTCHLTPDCKIYLTPWNVSTWPYKRVKFLCFYSLFSRLPIHVTLCLHTYSRIKFFSFSFTFVERFSRTEEILFFTISLPKCKPFMRTIAHTGTKPSSLHVTAH